jgi:hypothetical protein
MIHCYQNNLLQLSTIIILIKHPVHYCTHYCVLASFKSINSLFVNITFDCFARHPSLKYFTKIKQLNLFICLFRIG